MTVMLLGGIHTYVEVGQAHRAEDLQDREELGDRELARRAYPHHREEAVKGDAAQLVECNEVDAFEGAQVVLKCVTWSSRRDGERRKRTCLPVVPAISSSRGARLVVPGVWPIEEFADPVHLNGAGTGHFSKYLAPLLRPVVAP